jgi:hypothetical protein
MCAALSSTAISVVDLGLVVSATLVVFILSMLICGTGLFTVLIG